MKDVRHLAVSPIHKRSIHRKLVSSMWWCSIMLAGRLSQELAKILVAG
jgi:hypothetical protein